MNVYISIVYTPGERCSYSDNNITYKNNNYTSILYVLYRFIIMDIILTFFRIYIMAIIKQKEIAIEVVHFYYIFAINQMNCIQILSQWVRYGLILIVIFTVINNNLCNRYIKSTIFIVYRTETINVIKYFFFIMLRFT